MHGRRRRRTKRTRRTRREAGGVKRRKREGD
jgi:hypothetical protein